MLLKRKYIFEIPISNLNHNPASNTHFHTIFAGIVTIVFFSLRWEAKPEQFKPEQAKPERAKPEQSKPEQAKPEQRTQTCFIVYRANG